MRDKLLGWLDGERDRQLEFLRAFTRTDTCNPPGDTREAADFFRQFLDDEGIKYRTEAPQASMPNLIASFTGARSGRHFLAVDEKAANRPGFRGVRRLWLVHHRLPWFFGPLFIVR